MKRRERTYTHNCGHTVRERCPHRMKQEERSLILSLSTSSPSLLHPTQTIDSVTRTHAAVERSFVTALTLPRENVVFVNREADLQIVLRAAPLRKRQRPPAIRQVRAQQMQWSQHRRNESNDR